MKTQLLRLKAQIEAMPTSHVLIAVAAFVALCLAAVFVASVYAYVMGTL